MSDLLDAIINNYTCPEYYFNVKKYQIYQDEKGRTPLIIAIIKGKEDIAKKLIVKRNSINIQDKNGNSPLMYAILSMLAG